MARVARETGLVLSEAFAYRYHPLTAKIKEIIASGELGKVQHIEAQFCFLLPAPNNMRFKYELGGGALMDCGCYPVSLIRFLAEAEPTVEAAEGASILRPQVDRKIERRPIFCRWENRPSGLRYAITRLFRSSLNVEGDDGKLQVINPYHPHWFNWLSVRGRNGSHSEHIRGENVYALQLRAFIKAIRGEMELIQILRCNRQYACDRCDL